MNAGGADDSRVFRHADVALAAIFAVLGVLRILASGAPALFDQESFLALAGGPFPTMSSSPASWVIPALVRVAGTQDAALNGAMRSIALVLFVAAAVLLLRSAVTRPVLRVVLLALILFSPLPFLWLSTELFSAALVAASIACVLRRAPPWVTALSLGALAFCKPGMELPAVALGAVAVYRANPEARVRTAAFVTSGLLLWPIVGLLVDGVRWFDPGWRTALSFSQHYAALVAPHQLVSPPDPWADHQIYQDRLWGGVHGPFQAAMSQPSRYLEFVALAVARSLENVIRSGVWLVLVAAALVAPFVTPRRDLLVPLAPMTMIAPMLAVSFVHVRYTPRFLMCGLALLALGLENALASRGRARWFIFTCVAVACLWHLPELSDVWEAGYYFPD